MKRILGLGLGILTCAALQAQSKMETAFRADGKIYVVIGVMLLVLGGLTAYLVHVDRRTSALEKMNKSKEI